MNKRSFLILAMVALFTVVAASAGDTAGAELFKSKCAMCHGPNGAGGPMGIKLGAKPLGSPEVQKSSDAVLIETITKGRNKMPSYNGKLTADQIKSLVAHIRTLK